MSEATFYQSFVVGWFVLSALVFVALLFISAPYGRHTRAGWGPKISGTAGWVIMELPAVIVLDSAVLDAHGPQDSQRVPAVEVGANHRDALLHRGVVVQRRVIPRLHRLDEVGQRHRVDRDLHHRPRSCGLRKVRQSSIGSTSSSSATPTGPSLANLEYHHFKYGRFRRPGDVHAHFFGTSTLSFSAGFKPAPGDTFEIEMPGFGRPLRNTLARREDPVPAVRAL